MTKRCISCGMPMDKKEDFAMGNAERDYCLYCARPDGTMKSYDEALVGMTGFLVRSQGLDEKAATETARQMMTSLPAWKGR
jgi:hypothetical protein